MSKPETSTRATASSSDPKADTATPASASTPVDTGPSADKPAAAKPAADAAASRPKEIGGPKGPEPTRFGDRERDGRCVDF